MTTQDLQGLPAPLSEKTIKKIINSNAICCKLWGKNGEIIDVSHATLSFYGVASKEEFHKRITEFTPEYQPDGAESSPTMHNWVNYAFENEKASFDWLYKKVSGRHIDCRVSLIIGEYMGQDIVCSFAEELMDDNQQLLQIETPDIAQNRINIMLDAAPIGCYFYDSKGNVVDCNQHVVTMFEMSSKGEMNRSEMTNNTPKFQPNGELTTQYTGTKFMEAVTNGFVCFPLEVKSKSGRFFTVEITMVRVEYENDYAVLAYLRESNSDFEKLRQANAENIALQRMQLIVDNMPIGCNFLDTKHTMPYCNQAAATLYGFETKNDYLTKFNEYMPEFQPDGRTSAEVGYLHTVAGFEKGYSRIEWMHNKPDGSAIHVESTLIKVDWQGESILLNFMRDLTEILKYRETKRNEQNRLQAMLDSSPMVCAVFEIDGKILEANQAAATMFGLEDKDVYINRFFELSPAHQPDGTPSKTKRAWALENTFRKGSVAFEWMHQTLEGSPIPCMVYLSHAKLDDKDVCISYVQDLREQKEMIARTLEMNEALQREQQRIELAEESSRAKSRFLARMSHEIRTPIAAVLGISEIQLQKYHLDPEMEESFAKIHNSSSLLLNIINDILDLSRIEAGKMDLHPEEYEISNIIRDISHMHTSYLNDKKIEFKLHIDERLPRILIGDELRIMQIINNLLSNAFKYTDEGQVELYMQRREANAGYMMLVISIRDTGFGMNEEQLNALTNDYTRFHEQDHRNISGTGLGVPIVASLAEMMNANIELESEVGVGTNVTVYIPQKLAISEPLGHELTQSLQHFETDTQAIAKRLKFTPEPMPYGNVLVVDDVEANLYVAEGLLAFYGIQVETCDSGHEAIEKIKQGKVYDIIFLDQMMPELTGTETLEIIRAMGYYQPVVALTANALIGQAEEFMRNGFDGFISKPIQTIHLNSILVRHIMDKQPPEVIEAVKAGQFKIENDGGIENFQKSASLLEKLRLDFAKKYKNALGDIRSAIDLKDIGTAHRLMHSLKGLAGLIHEEKLSAAALTLENKLRDNELPAEKDLDTLEKELKQVLSTIKPPESPEENNQPIDKAKVLEMLNNLEPLLKDRNAESMNFLEELKKIPQAAIIARQVEEYDLTLAYKNIAALRSLFE